MNNRRGIGFLLLIVIVFSLAGCNPIKKEAKPTPTYSQSVEPGLPPPATKSSPPTDPDPVKEEFLIKLSKENSKSFPISRSILILNDTSKSFKDCEISDPITANLQSDFPRFLISMASDLGITGMRVGVYDSDSKSFDDVISMASIEDIRKNGNWYADLDQSRKQFAGGDNFSIDRAMKILLEEQSDSLDFIWITDGGRINGLSNDTKNILEKSTVDAFYASKKGERPFRLNVYILLVDPDNGDNKCKLKQETLDFWRKYLDNNENVNVIEINKFKESWIDIRELVAYLLSVEKINPHGVWMGGKQEYSFEEPSDFTKLKLDVIGYHPNLLPSVYEKGGLSGLMNQNNNPNSYSLTFDPGQPIECKFTRFIGVNPDFYGFYWYETERNDILAIYEAPVIINGQPVDISVTLSGKEKLDHLQSCYLMDLQLPSEQEGKQPEPDGASKLERGELIMNWKWAGPDQSGSPGKRTLQFIFTSGGHSLDPIPVDVNFMYHPEHEPSPKLEYSKSQPLDQVEFDITFNFIPQGVDPVVTVESVLDSSQLMDQTQEIRQQVPNLLPTSTPNSPPPNPDDYFCPGNETNPASILAIKQDPNDPTVPSKENNFFTYTIKESGNGRVLHFTTDYFMISSCKYANIKVAWENNARDPFMLPATYEFSLNTP